MTPAEMTRRIGFYVLICAITLFFAIPMLWIASAPFDSSPGLGVRWPDWTLDNFRTTLSHPYALHSMVNSLLICVTTAVTAFAALASYALSRVRIPGRDALLYGLLLLSSVVTGTAAMVPIFVMMFQLGLIDSRFGGALVMTGGLLPAAIFILKDFVDAVPKSYGSEGGVSVVGGSLPAATGSVPAGAEVTVGVRPEYLTLSTGDVSGPAIRGAVVVAENLGTMSLVSVDCGGTLIGVTVPEEHEPAPGTPVVLSAPVQRVLLYDKESGELMARQPATV